MGVQNLDIGKHGVCCFNGQLSLYLDHDWKYDPTVKVLHDSKNFPVVANDAEIAEVIVIDSDMEVETIEFFS